MELHTPEIINNIPCLNLKRTLNRYLAESTKLSIIVFLFISFYNVYCMFTGEQIVFLDLLKSFGMKMPNLSAELGIDMNSLLQMEQSDLINLLTQQSN